MTATASRTDSRYQAFTLRDVPWGQLGTRLEPGTVVTSSEAARLGGLDFQVELQAAGFYNPRSRGWKRAGNRRAVVRADTGAFFEYVSNVYKPIQFTEAFAFLDLINPNYVAAGTLMGGKQGFMVVQLPDRQGLDLLGGEDSLTLYVLLRTSHDMSRAMEVAVMPLRDRCMNALGLSSMTVGVDQRWAAKHVGQDPMAKLAEARETLSRTNEYAQAFHDIAEELADIDLLLSDARQVLDRVLPDKPTKPGMINTIVDSWQTSNTNGFAESGWGLVNAVSEFFEWGRPEGLRTPASRFTSGLTGDTYKYTNRTAQLLLRRR